MISKVTNIIKQYFFLLALVAMFVGFSAFKYAKTFDDPENGWYAVTIALGGDPENPEDQLIGGLIATPPPTDSLACAQLDNEGHICAIELEFRPDDNDNLPEMPITVKDAIADDFVDIEGEAREPEDTF